MDNKVIHYCWFGGKRLPKKVKKCINTWKKFLPEYEIKEWNEKNFDVNTCEFVKKAYENKKWAFVSDYVRIYALYHEGGIYFDTDMKIVKDVKNIINKPMFMGYEDSGYFGTAVIGVAQKENRYIKEILDYYNDLKEFNPEIIYNYANPVIITKIIKKYENTIDDNGINIFNNEIYIYPRDYFYPLSYDYSEKIFTKNTCMVHMFNATWTDLGERRTISIYRKFGPKLGKSINNMINRAFNFKYWTISQIKRPYKFARNFYSIHLNQKKRVNNIINELAQNNDNTVIIKHPEMVKENLYLSEIIQKNIIDIREQHTEKEAKKIANAIVNSKKENVIFNAYADGWDKIIKELKNIQANIKIEIILHENIKYLYDDYIWGELLTVIQLYNKRLIDGFVFSDSDLYDFYTKKGYNCRLVERKIEFENKSLQNDLIDKGNILKIGLYNAFDMPLYNIYNQIYAVSLIENAILDCNPINYKISMLSRLFNINLTGTTNALNNEELCDQMKNNSVNLFISFNDSNSILPIKSLESGVPCILGKYKPFKGTKLYDYLGVNNPDDINEIYKKINYVLENKTMILNEFEEWKKIIK